MAEVKEAAPRVGAGSPAGKRWFISKYPEWSVTVQPQEARDPSGFVKKPIRVLFIKQVKPWSLQGDGLLGSGNVTGTDKNDNPAWGVFPIEDPGPEPKSEKDKRNRLIIDFLRGMEQYRSTPQDNACQSGAKLKELDWDPRTLGDGLGNRVVARGRQPLGNPGPEAPAETRADKPAARVANMTGKDK